MVMKMKSKIKIILKYVLISIFIFTKHFVLVEIEALCCKGEVGKLFIFEGLIQISISWQWHIEDNSLYQKIIHLYQSKKQKCEHDSKNIFMIIIRI